MEEPADDNTQRSLEGAGSDSPQSVRKSILQQAACYDYEEQQLERSHYSIRSSHLSQLRKVSRQSDFESLPKIRGSLDQLEAVGRQYLAEDESKEFDFLVEIESASDGAALKEA